MAGIFDKDEETLQPEDYLRFLDALKKASRNTSLSDDSEEGVFREEEPYPRMQEPPGEYYSYTNEETITIPPVASEVEEIRYPQEESPVLSEIEQVDLDEYWEETLFYNSEQRDDTNYAAIIKDMGSFWGDKKADVPTPTAALPSDNSGRDEDESEECTPYSIDANGIVRNDVTLLGYDVDTNKAVTLGDEEATNHTHVLGVTGVGKSTLLINSFLGGIKRGQGGAYITPDKDAMDALIARIPPNRLQDVVYLNPGDIAYPFGFNLLFCPDVLDQKARERSADRLMHVFKRLWGPGTEDAAWGTRLENFLRNSIYTLMYHNLTIAEIPLLLQDAEFRDQVVSALPDIGPWYHVRIFWKNFDRLPFRTQDERTESTFNRVLAFVIKSTIENIVGQQVKTIDFLQIMQEQKILLVRLAEDDIQDDGVKLFGTMIVAALLEAALGREQIPIKERYYFSLICDEFPEFASDDFHKLLTRARKYKLKITIASQYLDRKDERIRRAVENAGNKVTFRTTLEDAPYFAPIYAKEPPPGEMIYEKVMRRAGEQYEVEYWDPPEAEEEYTKLQIETQQEGKVIAGQRHNLLTRFPLSNGNMANALSVRWADGTFDAFVKKSTAIGDVMTPTLWEIAKTMMYWFRPYEYDQGVQNYIKSWYEMNASPKRFEYSPIYDKDFWGRRITHKFYRGQSYRLDFQRKQRYVDLGLYDKDEVRKSQSNEFQYWAIKQDVRENTPYSFPSSLLSTYQHTGSNTSLDEATRREVEEMYAPLRPYARYYFDVAGYEFQLFQGWYDLPSDSHYPYFLRDWKGPYFRNDADWLYILKWVANKYLATSRNQTKLQQMQQQLEELKQSCFKRETRTKWLGWYEPVPVMEWEYVAEVQAFARSAHQEFIVGDNTKYTARQGPSPYTTTEMRSQMETELLRLPVHTAYTQLQNLQAESEDQAVVRSKLKTEPLPEAYAQTEEELAERIDFVLTVTRGLYCTPQAEVEEDIRRRRKFWQPEAQRSNGDESEYIITQPGQVAPPPQRKSPPVIVPEQPPPPQRLQLSEPVEKEIEVIQPTVGTMIACPNCGKENQKNAMKCMKCNVILQQGEDAEIRASSVAERTTESTPPEPPKRKKSRRG